MAGTIIADYIRSDANKISLNVGNTTFATINAMGFLSNTGVQIISPTGAINAASIAAGSIPAGKLGAASVSRTNMYSGAVLQVVNVTDRQQSSYTGLDLQSSYSNYGMDQAGVDLTTLNISLTPTSTSSKILILTNIAMGAHQQSYGVMRLKRGIGTTASLNSSYSFMSEMNSVPGTATQMGSSIITSQNQWQIQNINFQWLDNPATTSAVNYTFNIRWEMDLAATFYLNRAYYQSNDYGATSAVSSVTLLEIAG